MRQRNVTPGRPVTIVATRPTSDQYLHLREHAGLGSADPRAAESALAASLYSVCALHDNQVVGCGRIVGDGGLYFYIQDVIVEEAHRGQGTGDLIMQALLDWLSAHARGAAFIGLTATGEAAEFFRRHGFREQAGEHALLCLPKDALQPGRLSSPSK